VLQLSSNVHFVVQLSSFHNQLHGLQISAEHRTSVLSEFIQFLWVTGPYAAAPTHGCDENSLHHRLTEEIRDEQTMKNLSFLKK